MGNNIIESDAEDECVICMARLGHDIILGCNHKYCIHCIEEWCMKYTAHCPMCLLPVHGLTRKPYDIVYLSPHEVCNWGITVESQSETVDTDVVRLSSVQPLSIGEANGLRKNQFIRVFDTNGVPINSVQCIKEFARDAHSNSRLLKIQTLDLEESPPQSADSTGVCGRLCRLLLGKK